MCRLAQVYSQRCSSACDNLLLYRASLTWLQAARPRAIVDLIRSAEDFRIDLGRDTGSVPQPKKCERCGYICSQAVCKACLLLEGLNKGLPSMGISRPRQVKTRAAAKSAAAALKQDSNCACHRGSDAATPHDVDQSEVVHASVGCEAKISGCCGKGECHRHSGLQQELFSVAKVPDTVDHLVQEDEDSQSRSAHLASQHQQPETTDRHVKGDQLLSHRCHLDTAQVHGTNQQGLRSEEECAVNGQRVQSGNERIDCCAELHGIDSNAEVPVQAHGKQCESNLREVKAHPSARHRPLRADFDSTW